MRMKKKQYQKELRLLWVFGGLICSNLLTWLPPLCVSIPLISRGFSDVHAQLFFAVHVLFYSQVFFHPLVEIALLKEVREQIWRFLQCYRRRKNLDITTHPTTQDANSAEAQEALCNCCLKDERTFGRLCECLIILNAALLPQHSNSDSYASHKVHAVTAVD